MLRIPFAVFHRSVSSVFTDPGAHQIDRQNGYSAAYIDGMHFP